MRYLYVDNFRGFQNSFIPLKEVNFLVGENSTGKTSILSLLSIFLSPSFWHYQEFNTEEVQLGNFKDIVSINAENKNYFRFGIVEWDDNISRENFKSIFTLLITCIERDGIPTVSQFNYIKDNKEVCIIFSETSIRYKINHLDYEENISSDVMKKFGNWIREDGDREDFKKIKSKIPYGRRKSLIYIMNSIDEEFSNISKSNKQSIVLIPPEYMYDLAWIAPIRSKPKRIYDQYMFDFTPEGDHAPYLIKKILSNKKNAEAFLKFIDTFGEESGLFKSVSINQFTKYPASPFELDIVLENKPININSVGYGVSQCLPVIVELFVRPKETWYAIQQPEVHMHPKAQAALGDLFYNLVLSEKKCFFIETHSDFTIDRFRLKYRKQKNKSKIDSHVLFFERKNGFNNIYSIEIDKNGEYSKNQPKSFRNFFIKEELSLLGL